jgi:hypothetical protein
MHSARRIDRAGIGFSPDAMPPLSAVAQHNRALSSLAVMTRPIPVDKARRRD